MDYDLIIIGAGSAGYNGAALAHSLGLRIALIDGAKELGGLCILRGCMPSKALLAGANRFQQARHSTDFGINATDPSVGYRRARSTQRRTPTAHALFGFATQSGALPNAQKEKAAPGGLSGTTRLCSAAMRRFSPGWPLGGFC